MRQRFVLVALIVLTATCDARAAALPFSGSLVIEIGTLPPIASSGSGTATLSGAGHLSSIGLAGGTFAAAVSIPITDPASFPLKGVKAVVKNGAGTFTTSTHLGGPMAVIGFANVCLFSNCPNALANVAIPFTTGGVNGVGLGGAPITVTMLVAVTVTGGPWTTGIASTMTAQGGAVSLSGFIHGPASGGTSSAAAASGVVQLVTPVQIKTDVSALSVLPAFGILKLQFVPEPGTLMLVASGVAGLGILGRRRMRR